MKIFENLITTIRLLYTLVLPIIKNKISNIAFIINILLLFLTDYIDGTLARKNKVQTFYGSILDTVADKVLCVMSLILLFEENVMFELLLLGEIIIAVINILAVVNGKKTGSSKIGKIKMWLISITVIFGYIESFGIFKNYVLIQSMIIITFIIQLFTAIGYMKNLEISSKSSLNKDIMVGLKNMNIKKLSYILFDTNYYLENQ